MATIWECARVGPIEAGVATIDGKPSATALKAWLSENVPKDYHLVLFLPDPHRTAAEAIAASLVSQWPGQPVYVKVSGRSRCWSHVVIS